MMIIIIILYRTVRVWSVSERRLLRTFHAHTDEIEVTRFFSIFIKPKNINAFVDFKSFEQLLLNHGQNFTKLCLKEVHHIIKFLKEY